MFYRVRRRVDGVHSCQTLQRALSTSPRRLQVEPSLDAEIFTACRAVAGADDAPTGLEIVDLLAQLLVEGERFVEFNECFVKPVLQHANLFLHGAV